MAITPLSAPPSRSDPANFSSRADIFLGQLPTFATEANSLAADVNSKQSTASSAASTATLKAAEAVTSASNASTSASNASTSASNANTSANTANAWAVKTDGPVFGSEYSAKYWGQIAQGFVVGTLFDDGVVSSAKTWTSSKISTWAAKLVNGNTFTGSQNFFNYAGGFPAQASSYSIKVPGGYGGGYLLEDSSNYISLYSAGGTLILGFGSTATSIASKYSFTASGDFSATGTVSATNQMITSSIGAESKCILALSGQNDASFYSNTTGWGLYSNSGGNLVQYNRATGKRLIADIDSDTIWHNDNISFIPLVPGPLIPDQGRTRYPNGHIRQWGWTTVNANSTGTVSFSLAFPNSCIGATISIISASTTSYSGYAAVAATSQNSITINNRYNTQFTFYWEANGY